MRKTPTSCFLISAMILMTSIVMHAQDAQVAVLGAELSLYPLTNGVRPSTDMKPSISVVDKEISFSVKNLRRYENTRLCRQ